MNPERLLQNFDRLIDTPDAVPRLRRFILDLAVRGKLVEQNPEDEPAVELLKRIEAEKKRLFKAGKNLKEKQLPTIDVETPLFDLPESWEWASIRKITSDRGQKVPNNKFSYIDVSAIDKERGKIGQPQILTPDAAPSRARKIVQKGDVIYSCVRPYLLNIAVVDEEFKPEPIVSTAFAVLNGLGLVLPSYLWISLRSPYFVACVEDKMRGQAYPAINDCDFAPLPVPLPPLAEQHRIVAKVDELMKLCDELEAAQAKRERRRNRLVAATLHGLNNGSPDSEAREVLPFKDSTRFYFNHLSSLTTRPEHIQQLRQTILNLAVRGKLAPQDPSDEPAEELLKCILSEKSRLVKEGKIRKQTLQAEVEITGIPFALPEGWVWARLGDVIHLVSGQHLQPSEYSNSKQSGPPYITGPADFGQDGLVITRYAVVRKAVAKKGQILLTVKGAGVGKTAICDLPEVAISRQLMAMTAIKWSQWFLLLTTHRLAEKLKDSARSLIPGISREDVDQFVFPIPPLAEQHRIVAKVDELMALCDEMEGRINTNTTTSRKLLVTTLQEVLAGVN